MRGREYLKMKMKMGHGYAKPISSYSVSRSVTSGNEDRQREKTKLSEKILGKKIKGKK